MAAKNAVHLVAMLLENGSLLEEELAFDLVVEDHSTGKRTSMARTVDAFYAGHLGAAWSRRAEKSDG